MKPEKNLSVVPGESRGIWAAIAKLMRGRSVIDIVERFQTKQALQEERETKNFHPWTNGAVAPALAVNRMNSKPSTQRKSKSMEKK